ncbi:MAG: hypothetical protein OXC83_02980 [Chloroflexi bacterium]|nr:hypothetical protein [Chloroflexota bacterium]
MAGIRRIIGAALILVSLVVAVQFIAWRLYDSGDVWTIVNYISLVAIALAFYFNWERKYKNEASGEAGVTREYIESNVLYFSTMILAALFLFNWLNLLVNGANDVGVEVMHDVVWVVVDIMIIVVSGATGGYLLQGHSGE